MRALRRRAGVSLLLCLGAAACGGKGEPSQSQGAKGGGGKIPAALVYPKRATDRAPATFRARFRTTKGTFVIQVHRSWAPRGADRFYNLVELGYYDSVYVHRVLPGRVAQFGIYRDPRINYVWSQAPIPDDPVRESNTRGRVSFAHSGPNSRTTQVFVNLRDNSEALDHQGFAPFGEVVTGMDVVDSLYSGYGDGPPRGNGPYPAQAAAKGNAYFQKEFPKLDEILHASIVKSADSDS